MAEKDAVQKTLESYNDVFADIVNGLLFDGEEVIKESELVDAQPFSYYKMDDKNLHGQERDVSKFWNNGEIRLSFIGLENQTKPDKYMPLRVISYDAAVYRSQIPNKKSKNISLYPSITLVLYYGTKRHWKKDRALKDILKISPRLYPYVNDYKIHVFELAWLSDEQINKFKSDFRDVALFLRCIRTGDKSFLSQRHFDHVRAMLDLLRVMSDNEKKFADVIAQLPDSEISRSGGVNMSNIFKEFFKEFYEDGVEAGVLTARIEVAKKMLENGASMELVAKSLEMSEEKVKELIQTPVPVFPGS